MYTNTMIYKYMIFLCNTLQMLYATKRICYNAVPEISIELWLLFSCLECSPSALVIWEKVKVEYNINIILGIFFGYTTNSMFSSHILHINSVSTKNIPNCPQTPLSLQQHNIFFFVISSKHNKNGR